MLSMLLQLAARHWRSAIAAILLASALLWGSTGWRRADGYQRQSQQLTQQVADLQSTVAAARQAQEVSRAYQRDIDTLRRRVAALRLRPERCVPVTDHPATGPDAAARDAGLSLPYAGVARGALLDYAADCEATAMRLDGLQALSPR